MGEQTGERIQPPSEFQKLREMTDEELQHYVVDAIKEHGIASIEFQRAYNERYWRHNKEEFHG